jgi:hypothetical protein
MDRLEIAYAGFTADLKRIEHLVELVRSLRRLGASEFDGVAESAEWSEAEALWRDAKDRRTDLPLIAGSLLMYLAGRFEFFVRQSVEITGEEMAGAVESYSELPEMFRACLKSQVLELARNPRRYGFDDLVAEGYLKDFADLLNGAYDSNKVSARLLALTDANLKARVLADISKRLGMENFWKDWGKQAPLKLALEKAMDGEATAAAQSRLDALMEERNGLAHPTGEMTFPDPDKVVETINFVAALGQALRDILRVHLAQWALKPNSASP